MNENPCLRPHYIQQTFFMYNIKYYAIPNELSDVTDYFDTETFIVITYDVISQRLALLKTKCRYDMHNLLFIVLNSQLCQKYILQYTFLCTGLPGDRN